jgi:hypothetical protein
MVEIGVIAGTPLSIVGMALATGSTIPAMLMFIGVTFFLGSV